jgi:hypothetical protein
MMWNENCYRHTSQHGFHRGTHAAPLYDASAEKVVPTRFIYRRPRPRDLGSRPITILLGAYRKARSRDDRRVLLVATSKS